MQLKRWGALALALGVAEWSGTALGEDSASTGDAASQIEQAEAVADAEADAHAEGGWSLIPFVLPAYQPETSFLLGGAAILSHQPPRGSGLRESQLSFAGAASVRGQFTALLSPDLFLLDDRMHLGGTLSAARFPDTFYGVGPDTPKDLSEPYRANIYELELSPRWRIVDGLYVGPSIRLQNVKVAEVEDGGLLDTGLSEGASIDGTEGGTTLQLGVSAFWDTRSSTLYPTSGGIVRLNARRALPALGSDYEFDVLRVDARRYITLPWHSRHILALQGVVELRDGAPPFYDLARLGGAEIMRGYYEGRYRDRQLYALQAEYRAPLFWRFGGVLFASLGGVAHDVDSSFFDHPHLGGGAGLRFAPLDDVPVNFRLDVAFGDPVAFYLNVGEAF
ncbi:MAG TPA: BamA/TamA family outer membrane protein [Polyangiaceae bacterium]|nr:BamA/TamA family outer membrane protein [Polyangiaceae bacterium]